MRAATSPFIRFAYGFALASLAVAAACSSEPAGNGGPGSASGGTATGGAAAGGSATSGGATGGAISGAGAATGGSSSGAGATTGGAPAAAAGGALASGGASVSGGMNSSGGAGGASAGTGGNAAAGADGGKAGAGGASSAGTNAGGSSSGAFEITSPSWMNMAGCDPDMTSSCADLPKEITRSGAGTSPELDWTGAPAGTKSFAVVLQDLSGGSTHWVIWNIPATTSMLPANIDRTTAMPAIPAGSQQCGKGTDAATKFGYIGPGAPCNVYEFMLYALSSATFSPTSTTDPAMVRAQLNGLDSSTLLGTASLRGRTNMTCK